MVLTAGSYKLYVQANEPGYADGWHGGTTFAGATTGQQLLYALDEQVRRYEAEGKVTKYEFWEWLGTVKDESGRCIGSVALDLRTMEIRTFPAQSEQASGITVAPAGG